MARLWLSGPAPAPEPDKGKGKHEDTDDVTPVATHSVYGTNPETGKPDYHVNCYCSAKRDHHE